MNTAMQETPAPCPKCHGLEKVHTEKHGGTAFVKCDACGFKGPEFIPKEGIEDRKLLLAIVGAWNNLSR